MGKLSNRIAFITGAGTGLGRAIAIAFAKEGATVALNGRREEALREVQAEIGEKQAIILPADVTDQSAIHATRDKLLAATGGQLDIVVNNVGGVPTLNSISELTLDEWKQMINLNLTSQFIVANAFLPALRKNGNGKLISVTSALASSYMETYGAYSASKAGVEALMKTLAIEEEKNGIQVNIFDPIYFTSEGNPDTDIDPADIVAILIDLAATSSIEKSGEVVKPLKA
ncbi:hypothetical protein BEP19_02530 [Ammoniphilus oxalaticus]|uniref:Short-chain dehydrogenase n=1 Tax=Ammoniphilus oxalaticus TaxID=66863 RepID=A0A419SNF2_9BACL|nr:SDR family oxidoreductase [Ammoniphilus oxalaticus]RKD25830.1 hypothetical protein BEP19_02530 [Ammoniphilus oxalaticus]